MFTKNNGKTGIILMTYGSATTAEHVREYMQSIYKGKAPEDLIEDFENRYRLVRSSPLIAITQELARLLEKRLGENHVVESGMRHLAPTIASAVSKCRVRDAKRITGIILAPQFSSLIMEGYKTAFAEAAARHGFDARQATVAGPWSRESHFIQLLADRVKNSLAELNKKYGGNVPVIFTTHSLPKRVIEKDPDYLVQLQTTINALRERLEPKLRWYSGYQSAGHTPEEWLKPDITDILKKLRGKTPAVLIVPIQFVVDHLEILYDLDIAARKQCEDFGIAYHRIELPNTDSLFINALASLVAENSLTNRSRVD